MNVIDSLYYRKRAILTIMKKLYITFTAFLLIVPLFVSADSYDGPYCFEDPKMNTKVEGSYGSSTIRGTCKEIQIYTSVSIDPALKKDYLLGSHIPIGYDCYRASCGTYTKYSETVMFTSTSTLLGSTVQAGSEPSSVALFDRSFFIPSLTKLFKNEGLSFSPDSFPNVSIHILKKDEIDTIEKQMGYSLFEKYKKDALIQIDNYDLRSSTENDVITFLYQEYGKYIHAPKGNVYESNYVDVEKNKNLLNNNDLGITITQARSYLPTVSPASPLASVTNYWLYTKKNNKLVLSWQKTEYALDDGSIKTVTKDDNNVNASLLFKSASPSSASTVNSSASTSENNVVQNNETVNNSGSTVTQNVSLFQRFINFIASWFK